MTANNFLKTKRIHFIGIGGIGISAIARMMLMEGKKVTGSDRSSSEVIEELKKMGARVFTAHNSKNIVPDTELVIFTIAVPLENPELRKARELKIPTISYPQALGLISKDKFTIAVAGTHGKTTTTAMIVKIFKDAGLDPSAVIGSLLKDTKSNFISGKSKYFIVEACEYRRSFLELNPNILVITNIEEEHLDYYKDLKDIQDAFKELVLKVLKGGFIICVSKDAKIKPVLKGATAKVVDYKRPIKLTLQIPGLHNQENSAAAYKVAELVGVKKSVIEESLKNFTGTWRRFDFKGKTENGALIYDDYAHHPTEIKATLAGFKERFPKKRIIVVFQPHLFSRTKIFLEDFAKSFGLADKIIITPIYAAREEKDDSISSELLAEKIKEKGSRAFFTADFDNIKKQLSAASSRDIIVTMGAGDIYKLAEEIAA